MRESKKGFTLLELIVVISIIVILASVSIPMVEVTIKRQKELELRRNLRIIRMAIDEFKKFVDENKVEVDDDTYGFPEKLEDLVQGIEYRDKQNNEKIQKFLRRVPIDPITRSFEWGYVHIRMTVIQITGAGKMSGMCIPNHSEKPLMAPSIKTGNISVLFREST